ncbi:hypothetical protein F4781DRAFT_170039 [Annulohypoxylon bovei var. microspora]|nr:hypothetical protein F4781DRAFT_170039 [Annulohypoxylon bovei var. microspora]
MRNNNETRTSKSGLSCSATVSRDHMLRAFVITGHLALAATVNAKHSQFEYAHRYKLPTILTCSYLPILSLSRQISASPCTSRGTSTCVDDLAKKKGPTFYLLLFCYSTSYGTLGVFSKWQAKIMITCE